MAKVYKRKEIDEKLDTLRRWVCNECEHHRELLKDFLIDQERGDGNLIRYDVNTKIAEAVARVSARCDKKVDDLWHTIFAIEKCVAMKFAIPKTATETACEMTHPPKPAPAPDSIEKIVEEMKFWANQINNCWEDRDDGGKHLYAFAARLSALKEGGQLQEIVQPRAVRTMLRITPADFATHVCREPETQEEFDHFAHLAEESAMGRSISQTERHDWSRWDSALAEAGRIISEDYRKRKG